jgi:hypothetical protein
MVLMEKAVRCIRITGDEDVHWFTSSDTGSNTILEVGRDALNEIDRVSLRIPVLWTCSIR